MSRPSQEGLAAQNRQEIRQEIKPQGRRVTALLYWVWTRLGFRYGSGGIEGTQHGGAAGTGVWEGRLPSLFRERLGAGLTQAG
ncbi:hypothetical protein U876_05850 [Aeromonas hydrophila NJ-35]|nr:hypothetical protein V428_17390 [Aeromonas hydrophila subsp. hydrophila AL09-71]AHX70559.1 hypothetical protein V429_17425 [Aeromonas hydrophila pc104A]AJE38582.1 hypothetical protein V469_05870 [Aeromonas hydrophila J-1]AKJ36997.1 hypothetical protein U876_05850 [Aeromonas hydrophila NJ-35]ALQ62474.1 hypothetical protein AS145_06080 [Aeromonas hydrophila]